MFRNRAKEQAYTNIDSARYRGESSNFNFEIYCLIYEKNMRILERNGEAMPQGRAVQKFMSGIKPAWFAAGKAFVNGSDSHKNDFPRTAAYLASCVKHPHGSRRLVASLGTRPGGRGGKRDGGRGRGRDGGRGRGRGAHGGRGRGGGGRSYGHRNPEWVSP